MCSVGVAAQLSNIELKTITGKSFNTPRFKPVVRKIGDRSELNGREPPREALSEQHFITAVREALFRPGKKREYLPPKCRNKQASG